MRKPLLFTLVTIGLLSLACGGTSSETKTPETPPVETTDGLWQLAEQDGQDFVKAGSGQGLAVGTHLALVSAPLVGTTNRQLVGTATVAEVWPDLARITIERTQPDAAEAVGARLMTADEEKARTAEVAPRPPGPRPEDRPPIEAPPEGAPDMPPAFTAPSSEVRMDALARNENNPGMGPAIIWVMKNDKDDDVRFKAWRVVRARWKKGVASDAESEAATVWQAGNGSADGRIEAVELLGDKSDSLKVPGRFLADRVPAVRNAAAEAVFDVARRTNQKKAAKEVLEGRLAVEEAPGVKKKLEGLLGDL